MDINNYISQKQQKFIFEYIQDCKKKYVMPIVTSVDIRYAGFKIAPVDTNLFPAGFNNLDDFGLQNLVKQMNVYMEQNAPYVEKIMIFPENFTRNTKYLESLAMLKKSLAKFDVKICSSFIEDDLDLEVVKIYAISKMTNWVPDIILLNNDLTDGIPDYLENAKVKIVPDARYGWHTRRKSKHFECYNKLVWEICSEIGLDPWLLSAGFSSCINLDFKNKIGLESVAQEVEKLIEMVQEKYRQYGIKSDPGVFIKPNQGTYGMGVMVAKSAQDVLDISKKKRHSMNALKHGVINSEVLIQEGVPTVQFVDGAPAETMCYMASGEIIRLMQRSHRAKDVLSNLNSRGMMFQVSDLLCSKDLEFTLTGCVGILASLACCFEIAPTASL